MQNDGKIATARAPGVVKLFGEHAVVYGKTALAMGVDRYATVSASASNGSSLKAELRDFDKKFELSENEIYRAYGRYCGSHYIAGFVIDAMRDYEIDKLAVPFAVLAGRLCEMGISINRKVSVESGIPLQKGYASSAAISTAFVLSMLGKNADSIEPADIIDMARDGDRILHENKGAGLIDVSTSYYGSFVSFSMGTGIKQEKVDSIISVVVIDTGPKLPTSVTVGGVSKRYKENRDETSRILDKIDECSKNGIEALKDKDLKTLGMLMYENHKLLKQLGVSSEKLDSAVELAMKNGAYGAKLSGGGGGGIAIAVAEDPEELKDKLSDAGLSVDIVKTAARSAEAFS